jgi:hypothetical protein
MIAETDLGGLGIEEWFVVFHERTPSRLCRFLAAGRFQHVSAFGYAGRAKVWVRIEYSWRRIEVSVCGREDEAGVLNAWSTGGPVLRVAVGRTGRPLWGRIGLWCVPLTAHLLGVRTCALRPDRLWSVLLAQGAERVDSQEADDEDGRPRPGPGDPAPAARGAS